MPTHTHTHGQSHRWLVHADKIIFTDCLVMFATADFFPSLSLSLFLTGFPPSPPLSLPSMCFKRVCVCMWFSSCTQDMMSPLCALFLHHQISGGGSSSSSSVVGSGVCHCYSQVGETLTEVGKDKHTERERKIIDTEINYRQRGEEKKAWDEDVQGFRSNFRSNHSLGNLLSGEAADLTEVDVNFFIL